MSTAARSGTPPIPRIGGLSTQRGTMRVRLTLLYGALFLLFGTALVGVTYVLFERATAYSKPALPRVPQTPAIHALTSRFPNAPAGTPLSLALGPLNADQHQLVSDRRLLAGLPFKAVPGDPLNPLLGPLERDQHQLAADQHQLARSVGQLAAAVHQVSRAGAVQAAQQAADSHRLLIDSGIALAIVAVLALLAGWLVTGRMLRPIRTITRTAQRISSANLKERLALDGPHDELQELGDTLDDLFGRLDAAFEAQRQFVANASHELRAPLTRQRALIQVALADPQASFASLRNAHERVLVSERHLEQLIDALLALTRGQAGVQQREPFDLATIAARVLLARGPVLAELELELHQSLGDAPAQGDPRLIERLATNLIDNAIRHNTPGGEIAVTTGTRDRHAFFSIANTGPIVPPEQLTRLFEPFERLDGARTRHTGGHGLGLSIVRAIATAHHAELDADARPGGGLTIEVSFPPATDVSAALTPAPSATRRGALRSG